MEKIKIAQVITRLDWGGSPDILRIICNYLNRDLYDITLVTGLTKHPSEKTKEFLKKFNQKTVVIRELKRNINPISDLAAFIRLYLLLRREKFDIVHTHTAKAGILGRIAAHLAGIRIIIHSPHGHNFYGYFGPLISKMIIFIERLVAHFTDRLITLTELEKKDFVRFRIAEARKVTVVYQGLELDRYTQVKTDKIMMRKEFNIELDEALVGFIGRFEPIKGPVYLVEAAKEVVQRSGRTKFIMVGDGSLFKILDRRTQDLGIKDRFIFTGWREDIPEILSILNILVLPSLNEAVGMVLIEAQACGVSVVASRVGGIPEIVKDNQTGVLVPAGDSKELSRAINYLLADEQKRLRMSEEARNWVRNRFKAEDMVNKISSLYQELINRNI